MEDQKQGTLSVHTENIFPIIKKFLYSDHEIFLRELVANATDATRKVKLLSTGSDFTGELGDLTIKIALDADAKTLTISDAGIGMTEAEVEQYINQIAFSSAEEWVNKYADKGENAQIIGHFGLGFYSAFMVASRVELQTLSYKEGAESVHWDCIGTTTYTMQAGSRESRGTDVVLHIGEDSAEFLEASRIEGILKRYCKFMPFPIEFNGTVINQTEPLWTRKPSEITDEEYQAFYQDLHPFSPEPHFHIHLNVDYPFNLTGILYFPKLSDTLELQKNKVQLYSNQVFVTDEVKEVLPEFLAMLHGVIDSPDIPLNVSRSYLQADGNVKKISGYIVRKVADKLAEIYKNDKEKYEEKWSDVGFFVKYGLLTDDKFFEKAKDFTLVKNLDGEYFTLEGYKEKVAAAQTSKADNVVWLYTHDADAHQAIADAAKRRGWDVLLLDQPIDNHFIQFIEGKLELVQIRRLDADTLDNLIPQQDKPEAILSEDEQKQLTELFQAAFGAENSYTVKVEPMATDDLPVLITRNEWMRRFSEMNRMSGAGGAMPNSYDLIVNANHPMMGKILQQEDATKNASVNQLIDLAKLSNGLLVGKELASFVERSVRLLNNNE